MTLTGLFALLALLLAGLGVYGIMSYNVARPHARVRHSLGARRVATAVLGLVLREGLATTLCGLVAGFLLVAVGAVAVCSVVARRCDGARSRVVHGGARHSRRGGVGGVRGAGACRDAS